MKTLNPSAIISVSEDYLLLHLNKTSLSEIVRRLSELTALTIKKKRQNLFTDEAFVSFCYDGFDFEITTPISDYLIERPVGCPTDTFARILDQFRPFQPIKEEAEQVGDGDAEEAV